MRSDLTRLGGSTQHMGRLAFGCEQLGGYEWGEVIPGEVVAAIELAVAAGVTLFDTADCYGRGESERRLGRALAAYRERVIIATKFGVRFSDSGDVWYDSSPHWAEVALEKSLRRLGSERVDLLQMHYWDGVTPLAALFERLERLRERGKIRWYGITNCALTGVVAAHYPGLVSASLEYSLVERAHEGTAQELTAAGLTFLAHGSLGQGILSGKYRGAEGFAGDDRRARARYRNFHGERFSRNLRIVEALSAHAQQLGASPVQLALAWLLQRLPGSAALVGIKRPQQLSDALGALRLSLPAQTAAALESVSQQCPTEGATS